MINPLLNEVHELWARAMTAGFAPERLLVNPSLYTDLVEAVPTGVPRYFGMDIEVDATVPRMSVRAGKIAGLVVASR